MIFWTKIDTPLEFFVILCAIFVVFVNGSTDAPNAIFSVVSTGKLKLWQSGLLSGAFNFLGVIFSCLFGGKIAKSVIEISPIKSGNESAALCLSCFLTIILFGLISWVYGMPSSESHALIFSLAGASFAASGNVSSFLKSTASVLFYMTISCLGAYLLTHFICRAFSKTSLPCKNLLGLTCALASYMHGAQDGQKFIALLLILLGMHPSDGSFFGCLPIILLVGSVIFVSTLFGGKKIIDSMTKISSDNTEKSAFFSDVGTILTLIICSLLGAPISTGNVKSFSIFATARKISRENKKMISKILLTSLITLPICFVMGALLYILFSRLI